MKSPSLYYLATPYGSGGYNEASFSSTDTSAGTSTGTAAGPAAASRQPADTGFVVLVAITLACLIIFVALVVRFWRRMPTRHVRTSDFGSTDISPTD